MPNEKKKQPNLEEKGENRMQPSYEEKTEKFSMIRKKPHHVPPHLHNAIELVYVTKGELELGVGYELYHMEKGDFAVVFPDLIHHYQVFSKESNEVYQIYASLELSGPIMTQQEVAERLNVSRKTISSFMLLWNLAGRLWLCCRKNVRKIQSSKKRIFLMRLKILWNV